MGAFSFISGFAVALTSTVLIAGALAGNGISLEAAIALGLVALGGFVGMAGGAIAEAIVSKK